MEYLITEERLKKIKNILNKKQKDLQVFVEDVKNQHNFSAIIRTCDAVGVLKLYYTFSGIGGLINESITMGSHKWLLLEEVKDVESFLLRKKEEGFQILTTHLSEKSVHFREIDYTKPSLIVMGNELKGVSEKVLQYADKNIIIPMYGMAQSLNVSVATAVILYEAQRQRELKGMYKKPQLTDEEMEEIIRKWAIDDVIKNKSRGRLR